jgi:uncharacterized membrane-anchored protein YitT (DUF2179 family)
MLKRVIEKEKRKEREINIIKERKKIKMEERRKEMENKRQLASGSGGYCLQSKYCIV